VSIGGGESVPRATLATLGPGSGLGVAALVPAADGWAVMTGEGGHVSMPASSISTSRTRSWQGGDNRR
jgi:glucokinase